MERIALLVKDCSIIEQMQQKFPTVAWSTGSSCLSLEQKAKEEEKVPEIQPEMFCSLLSANKLLEHVYFR